MRQPQTLRVGVIIQRAIWVEKNLVLFDLNNPRVGVAFYDETFVLIAYRNLSQQVAVLLFYACDVNFAIAVFKIIIPPSDEFAPQFWAPPKKFVANRKFIRKVKRKPIGGQQSGDGAEAQHVASATDGEKVAVVVLVHSGDLMAVFEKKSRFAVHAIDVADGIGFQKKGRLVFGGLILRRCQQTDNQKQKEDDDFVDFLECAHLVEYTGLSGESLGYGNADDADRADYDGFFRYADFADSADEKQKLIRIKICEICVICV